jgi:hypothetical protein
MDPNQKPTEPQRTSQPQPGEKPMEAPQQPNTEYERNVPHQGNEPIAHTGKSGEGSYEGTKQYDDGLDAFTKNHPVDESIEAGKKIDVNDPSLKAAEEKGKAPAKSGGERKPTMSPDQGRTSSPSIA